MRRERSRAAEDGNGLGIFRTRSRELAPVLDGNSNWSRAFVSLSIRGRRGRVIPYRGRVLQARSGPAAILAFVCRSSALLPARIRIAFCVKTSTTVTLSIGEHVVKTVRLEPYGEGIGTLRTLTCRVTRWTEAVETTTINLRVLSDGEADAVLILDSEDQPCYRRSSASTGRGPTS
jgi:hypothetical protein